MTTKAWGITALDVPVRVKASHMQHHEQITIGDLIGYSPETLCKDICTWKLLPPARADSGFMQKLDRLEALTARLLRSSPEELAESEIDISKVSSIVNTVSQYRTLAPRQTEKDGFRKLLDRYQHVEWKYSGSHSVLLKAENVAGQEVAIKIPRMNHPFADSIFCSELEAAGTMKEIGDHPNLVSFITSTTDPYNALVMEWIPGVTVWQYWDQNFYDIKFEHVIRLMLGVTRALKSTHDRGRIHLDIHPQNIIFRGQEPDSSPVLIDWDLSGIITASGGLTSQYYDQDHRLTISTEYAAPEQLSSEYGLPSPKTDVYRLGLILHDLLSQSGDDPSKSRTSKPSALGFVPSNIKAPPRLCEMLEACLQMQVPDRCSLDDLGQGLADISGINW